MEARCTLGILSNASSPSDTPWGHLNWTSVGSPEHLALSRTAALESIVLLRNEPVESWEGRKALPLDVDMFKRPLQQQAKPWRLAVIGPLADSSEHLFGNYYGTPAAGAWLKRGFA